MRDRRSSPSYHVVDFRLHPFRQRKSVFQGDPTNRSQNEQKKKAPFFCLLAFRFLSKIALIRGNARCERERVRMPSTRQKHSPAHAKKCARCVRGFYRFRNKKNITLANLIVCTQKCSRDVQIFSYRTKKTRCKIDFCNDCKILMALQLRSERRNQLSTAAEFCGPPVCRRRDSRQSHIAPTWPTIFVTRRTSRCRRRRLVSRRRRLVVLIVVVVAAAAECRRIVVCTPRASLRTDSNSAVARCAAGLRGARPTLRRCQL